jgi:hypothetical protein
MASIEGLRVITLDNVPINVILENIPKPIRVTGFDTSKKKDLTSTTVKKSSPDVFTFTPDSICKTKVE